MRNEMKTRITVVFFLFVFGCSGASTGADGGSDVPVDTRPDSIVDVGTDTAIDVEKDMSSDINITLDIGDDVAMLESEIRADLDGLDTDVDFTLLIETPNGARFVHSVGASTATTRYASASTSKWIAAATILHFVLAGDLSLDDRPQDHIATWPATGNLAEIKLRDLLSFTSGLETDPLCRFMADADFFGCVETLANRNGEVIPATGFSYGWSHLQVAGAMTVEASGLDDWESVFAKFVSDTGILNDSVFDQPSTTNPRVAGGMTWTAEDYLDFLRALFSESILTSSLIAEMHSDQVGALPIVYSPAKEGINEDWHYGFGNWFECHVETFDCDERTRVSSPGAFGAYPFIDYEHQYFGIVAREGEIGSFREGYKLFESIEPKLLRWVALNR